MKIKITMTADLSKLISYNHDNNEKDIIELLTTMETHTIERLMTHLSSRGKATDQEHFLETKIDYEEDHTLADMLVKSAKIERLD